MWAISRPGDEQPVILAIDTSTAACSVALFDASGTCVASSDEHIGRGHAERLVPIVETLLAGKSASKLLVGVGPGSFTGIRVGIAAAQGLAIGWNAEIHGMSSLALIAAGSGETGPVAAVMDGGHGELFVQQFDANAPRGDVLNLSPDAAAAAIDSPLLIGPAAEKLLSARRSGRAVETWPSARFALNLSEPMRSLPPKPIYARAPDAKVRSAA